MLDITVDMFFKIIILENFAEILFGKILNFHILSPKTCKFSLFT